MDMNGEPTETSTSSPVPEEVDVLILGCGIAGATAALVLSDRASLRIAVVSHQADPSECATRYAQGGIVARGVGDSAQSLAADIHGAAAGLALMSAVAKLCEVGPQRVHELLVERLRVPFTRTATGDFDLAQEGGHSRPRILHERDQTGLAIESRLLAELARCPNVTLVDSHTAVDLVTVPHHARDILSVYRPARCCGAYILDQKARAVSRVLARATILATGGMGQIFRHTTNPHGARGDGYAMAHRAGANLVNMEYIQFHPTSLAVPGARNALITEALRGAGARLLTPRGEAFMQAYAPGWGDLAPRDITARAMHGEMLEHGYPYLLLDARGAVQTGAFPSVESACRDAGVDPFQEPIPVVPAAHYACGGVLVDDAGRTTLPGLYAVGEVSCTGVHGANRLASTSLLEGLVWGAAAAEDIVRRADLRPPETTAVREWESAGDDAADPVLVQRDLESVQNTMWHYVGLSRRGDRLARAADDLDHLWRGISSFYRTRKLDDGLIGLRNAAQCAWLTCLAALRNRSSRGAHWREDASSPR